MIVLFDACPIRMAFMNDFVDLKKISERQESPVDLSAYVKKLNNARRRVMLVNNILQNVRVSLIC